MQFPNYDRLIRMNRRNLIESYVKQYGESNREYITEKFDQIKFCFYSNPRKIKEYIETKSANMGRRFTIDILKQIGLDVSKLYIDKDGNLTSSDEETKLFILAFFPEKGIINCSNKDDGIFSFSSLYEEDTDFNLYKKGLVFQQLGHIDSLSEMRSFIETGKYKMLNEIIQLILPIAERYKRILFYEFEEISQYMKELEQKERDIIYEFSEQFVNECKIFLSTEDRRMLVQDEKTDLRMLKSLDFVCDRSSVFGSNAFNTEMPLESGLLEYFLPEYTAILQEQGNEDKKELIIAKRMEYLRKRGVNITSLNIAQEDFFARDWYELPGISDKLPNIRMVEKLKTSREKYQLQCMKKLAPLYVINNYQFKENSLDSKEIRRILFLNTGEYVCRCVTNNGDVQDLIVFISPLDGNYKVLDVTLDHEIRHGLEYMAEIISMPFDLGGVKEGTQLEMLKAGLNFSFYIDGDRAGHSNLRINEVMTQKLSLESTRERYERGIYILTSPEDATLNYTSNYDCYIPNFDYVFTPEMQDLLLKSRICSRDSLPIYSMMTQEVLTQIDEVIMDNSPEAKAKLEEIKKSLTEAAPGVKM